MNNILEYKGYCGSVEYSAEDEVFFGRIIGIADHITFEGNSVRNLKRDFESSVDEYLESCKELGKEPEKSYKGSFNVRIKPALHRDLAIFAKQRNQTLNHTVEEAITHFISA